MSERPTMEGFRTPDRSCSQIPFWFLNGPVDGKEWARQIEEMAAHGVYQAMPHPRYGMDKRDYLTNKYWHAFSELVDKAVATGFTLHLYDEYNWSSGPAGGRVTAHRKNCALALGLREKVVEGPAVVTFDEWTDGLQGMSVPESYVDVVLVPMNAEGEVDLAQRQPLPVPTGPVTRLEVAVPAGRWQAMVFYTLRFDPGLLRMGVGGIINYLSDRATDLFIKATHDEYAARYSPYFGTIIPSIFYDEVGPYAGGPFSWVEDLPEQFKARKGYDILPLLPLLFHDGGTLSEKLRCDYWDATADLFVERFIGKIADWCQQHGIALVGHGYETSNAFMLSADLYRALRRQQWVAFDSLGESQPFSTLKVPVSVAHVKGERVVLCESLGCMGGWAASPRMARGGYNRLAMAGVTHFVPHGFFQTVDSPKIECPPSYFEDTTYWKYYDQIAGLTSRLSFMNRQGTHVADVAVFYPIVSWWGDSAGGRGFGFPWQVASWRACKAKPDCEAFDAIINTLVPQQIDLDVVDGEALARSSVKNGCLHVADESFQALVVPPMHTIRLDDLRAILTFAEQGGRVFVVARLPSVSMDNGRDDAKLADLVARLRPLVRLVATPAELPELIRTAIQPDVSVLKGYPALLLVSHRRTDTEDVYFLGNASPDDQPVRLGVRAEGHASLWDPATGSAYHLPARSANGMTETEVRLEPGEGSFLVISQAKPETQPLPPWRTAEPKRVVGLDGPWKFMPVPHALEKIWTHDVGGEQELRVPVFRTATDIAPTASGLKNKDGRLIPSHWYKNDFDDHDWDVVHCLREPLFYDDFGSRFFRSCIPDGARAVKLPLPIEKEYVLYADETPLRVVRDHAAPEQGWLDLPGHGRKGRMLALQCASMAPSFGLTGPLVFRCEPVETALGSWTDMGLWWYSGRCLYQKRFAVDEAVLAGPGRICINLGDVRECAEVWVNGTLAGTRIWPPYRIEITGLLKPGENEVCVVATNLPSNRYSWDVWGSRGSGPVLASGLLGPVILEYY